MPVLAYTSLDYLDGWLNTVRWFKKKENKENSLFNSLPSAAAFGRRMFGDHF